MKRVWAILLFFTPIPCPFFVGQVKRQRNPTHLLGYGYGSYVATQAIATLWLTPPVWDTWTYLNPTYKSRLFSIWTRYRYTDWFYCVHLLSSLSRTNWRVNKFFFFLLPSRSLRPTAYGTLRERGSFFLYPSKFIWQTTRIKFYWNQ